MFTALVSNKESFFNYKKKTSLVVNFTEEIAIVYIHYMTGKSYDNVTTSRLEGREC